MKADELAKWLTKEEWESYLFYKKIPKSKSATENCKTLEDLAECRKGIWEVKEWIDNWEAEFATLIAGFPREVA